jgi:hypothetical protein
LKCTGCCQHQWADYITIICLLLKCTGCCQHRWAD